MSDKRIIVSIAHGGQHLLKRLLHTRYTAHLYFAEKADTDRALVEVVVIEEEVEDLIDAGCQTAIALSSPCRSRVGGLKL